MKNFDLKVGTLCNNNCVHCVLNKDCRQENLTTEEICNIISSLRETNIILTGGEVSIRDDFVEIIEHIAKTENFISLQTNGTGLIDQKIAVLSKHKKRVVSILLAIHSCDPDIHNAVTGGHGMFEKTMIGFENCLKENFNMATQLVISKINMNTILPTFDFEQKLSPNIQMRLTYPHITGNAEKNIALIPSLTELRPVLIEAFIKHGENIATESIPKCYKLGGLYEGFSAEEDLLCKDISGYHNLYGEETKVANYALNTIMDHKKGKYCYLCKYNCECIGTYQEYFTYFQDIFPVT